MKIAIDGPAGAGKSTVARRLARDLGLVYIDTGAMYRALTWKAVQQGLDLNDVQSLVKLASSTNIHFEHHPEGQKIVCDQQDVTAVIRTPAVNESVSTVASYPAVRAIMVQQQQELASNYSVVVDGRDIGECVLPDADYKIFLTASLEQRARRRQRELHQQGYEYTLEQMEKDIQERDRTDAGRPVGALKVLPDSIVIDSSDLPVEAVVKKIKTIIGEREQ